MFFADVNVAFAERLGVNSNNQTVPRGIPVASGTDIISVSTCLKP